MTEYWIFQPQDNITVLELANLISKLKKIPKGKTRTYLYNLLGVCDKVYDKMPQEYKRHFIIFTPKGIYLEYTNIKIPDSDSTNNTILFDSYDTLNSSNTRSSDSKP